MVGGAQVPHSLQSSHVSLCKTVHHNFLFFRNVPYRTHADVLPPEHAALKTLLTAAFVNSNAQFENRFNKKNQKKPSMSKSSFIWTALKLEFSWSIISSGSRTGKGRQKPLHPSHTSSFASANVQISHFLTPFYQLRHWFFS